MIGIHFFQFPDAVLIGFVSFCTIRAVADTFCLCFICLLLIYLAHGRFIKQADIKQFCVLTTTKHILKDTSTIGNEVICH